MTMHNTEKHCDYLDLADLFIYSVTVCALACVAGGIVWVRD